MLTINNHDLNWYAIYTRSRFEKKLYSNLCKSNIAAFLPLVKVKRQWHDRIKTVETPLLPSYVFVHARKEDFLQIYPLSGFVRFVTFQGRPAKIKEREIELLRCIVAHGKNITPHITGQVGDVVRITSGSFKGWEGVVSQKLGSNRIIFQLESIQQMIAVELESSDVEILQKVC